MTPLRVRIGQLAFRIVLWSLQMNRKQYLHYIKRLQEQ